jgi:uncharacterized coiled-coil protein SlyX
MLYVGGLAVVGVAGAYAHTRTWCTGFPGRSQAYEKWVKWGQIIDQNMEILITAMEPPNPPCVCNTCEQFSEYLLPALRKFRVLVHLLLEENMQDQWLHWRESHDEFGDLMSFFEKVVPAVIQFYGAKLSECEDAHGRLSSLFLNILGVNVGAGGYWLNRHSDGYLDHLKFELNENGCTVMLKMDASQLTDDYSVNFIEECQKPDLYWLVLERLIHANTGGHVLKSKRSTVLHQHIVNLQLAQANVDLTNVNTQLTARVAELQLQVGQQAVTINALQVTVHDNQATIHGLTNVNAELQLQVGQQADTINALQVTVHDNQATIHGLEAQVHANQVTIGGFQGQLGTAQDNINGLQQQVANREQQINALREDNYALNSVLDTVRDTNTNLQQQQLQQQLTIAQLQHDLQQERNDRVQLQATVNNLQAQLQALVLHPMNQQYQPHNDDEFEQI